MLDVCDLSGSMMGVGDACTVDGEFWLGQCEMLGS